MSLQTTAGEKSDTIRNGEYVCHLARKLDICIQLEGMEKEHHVNQSFRTYQLKVKLKANHPSFQCKTDYIWGFQSPMDSTGSREWKTAWVQGLDRLDKCKSNSFRCRPFPIQHQDERSQIFCGAVFQVMIHSQNESDLVDFEDYTWVRDFTCTIEISLHYSEKNILGRSDCKGLAQLQTRAFEIPKGMFTKGSQITPKYTSVRFDGINFSALDVLFSVLDFGDEIIFWPKSLDSFNSSQSGRPIKWFLWTRQYFQGNAADVSEKSGNSCAESEVDKVMRGTPHISNMLASRNKQVALKLQNVANSLHRQSKITFDRIQIVLPRFLESLNREHYLEIFQQIVESKFRNRQADMGPIQSEVSFIANWLKNYSENASEFRRSEFEDSLEALRITIFEEYQFESVDRLSPFVDLLDVLSEMLLLTWKLLLSQSLEEGGCFMSMNSLYNFRATWAQIIRKKYLKTCIMNSQEASNKLNQEWANDLDEYEALGGSQLYGQDHQYQCQLKNIQRMSRSTLGDSARLDNTSNSSIMSSLDSVHLVVYVHGFLGASTDLRVYKNHTKYFQLFFIDQEGIVLDHGFSVKAGSLSTRMCHLMSESNEDKTDKLDISQMGQNLAVEISDYIEENNLDVCKMSFICHSLGGLIARCALQHPILENYASKLELFQTFSTPHASLSLSPNTLFNSGKDGWLSVWQAFQTSPALEQLLLRDKTDVGISNIPLLSTLSKEPSIGKFKKVRFFGSEQDGYTPCDSACVSYTMSPNESVSSNSEYWKFVKEIQQNMHSAIEKGKVEIFEAWNIRFMTHGKGPKYNVMAMFDSIVGRKAHIAMIDNYMLADIVIILNDFHI